MARVNNLTNYFQIKDDVNVYDLQYLDPFLMMMLAFTLRFMKDHEEPVTITSLTDDSPLRKTDTHAEGRAFDMRVRGISRAVLKHLVWEINRRYGAIYGTGPADRTPRVAILKKDHIHFQVRRGLTWQRWPA
jgi:hypothetical protein